MTMWTVAATDPAGAGGASEDWHCARDRLIVVLDGATARTDTGCEHGTAWFTRRLGSAITTLAGPDHRLPDTIAEAIETVAAAHRRCDLTHPGTPAAALGVLRLVGSTLDYAVLGDVTMVFDHAGGDVEALTDDRVEATARAERDAADRLAIDSPDKRAALVEMKRAELAARNTAGGYWVAAADPAAAGHAMVGSLEVGLVRRAAVLTDGAARAVTPFAVLDWTGLLNLVEDSGPGRLINLVRQAEASDPTGVRWPRNKRGDDATVVYAAFDQRSQ
jgi:hypothetical protein